MFDRLVMGVDPGVAATGVATVAWSRAGRSVVLGSQTIRTPAGSPDGDRLYAVYRTLRRALADTHPETVAVERLMWGRNVGSAMAVARASGVVLLAAAEAGIPVREYAPLEVKLAVTGNGNAAKDEVRLALRRLHAIADLPPEPDAIDAVAVALCHIHRSPLREAAR